MARPFEETIEIALRTAIMPGLVNNQVAGALVSLVILSEIRCNHIQIMSALADVSACYEGLSSIVETAIGHVQNQKCEAEAERRQQRTVDLQLFRDDLLED